MVAKKPQGPMGLSCKGGPPRAGRDALTRLSKVRDSLRLVSGVAETEPGEFVLGSRTFVHFHEEGADLIGDVRTLEGWKRFVVTWPEQRAAFVEIVRAASLGRL